MLSDKIDLLGALGSTGLVFGKFYPLHKGHEYLIRYASNCCTKLDVLMCFHPNESQFAERLGAMGQFCATLRNVTVHYRISSDLPEWEDDDDEAYKRWTEVIRFYSPDAKYVFTSEDYGWTTARHANLHHVPVNPLRTITPVSARLIREKPFAFWDYLSDFIKPHYQKRVYVLGPESCGKTTLAKALAHEFDGTYVPEFGRDYYEMRFDPCEKITGEDLANILVGHEKSIEAASHSGKKFLFIDTDAIATKLFHEFWNKELLNVENLVTLSRYDLTLFCEPDIPYEDGEGRILKDRDAFAARYKEELQIFGIPYQPITGMGYIRTRNATEIVAELL
jgi:HTH-type transcriptional repressor of NAD biosynthesis genes